MENINKKFKSFNAIFLIHENSKVKYYFWTIIILLCIILFLPWTQNITTYGEITTLKQESRLQKLYAPIAGKIIKWYVKEGDYVKKNDTILILSEIKTEYLDPNLISRTETQLKAKNNSIYFYKEKISTTAMQIANLKESKKFKIEQLRNKLIQTNNKLLGEKAELSAIENEYNLYKNQYERQLKMFEQGLVSQTQLQQRNMQFQNATAKKISSENKIAQTNQELINIKIEQNGVEQDYTEKINKIEGDKFQYLSQIATTEGDIAKLENSISNYSIRNNMYVITAPQDGQIIQAAKSGIGEILKDGDIISSIVPLRLDYCVETHVKPIDLPLLNLGQKVTLTFDGYPVIVFSGWPENSYGTFLGKIVVIENTISKNGLYKILIAEDSTKKKWPPSIRLGVGANGFIILNNVPIWYEIWRNINGFPMNFYKNDKDKDYDKTHKYKSEKS